MFTVISSICKNVVLLLDARTSSMYNARYTVPSGLLKKEFLREAVSLGKFS
jgi:hypothetical protein